MRNDDHRLSRRDGDFIVFTEASGMVEPGKCAFHHPAPRNLFPLVRFDFLGYIHSKTELFFHIRGKSPPVPSVHAELLDRRISFIRLPDRGYSTFCVMNIGCMNDNRQQTTQHIHYDVPLSAFCFFPPSIPRSSLAATVFTLWESMIAQLGLSLRPTPISQAHDKNFFNFFVV